MGKLVVEDLKDCDFVVVVVGEVHVDRVCADVWVFGRMYSREVLVLDEYRAMCRGQRDEGERALQVLAGRRVVEVDGVGVKNVVAIGCRGVDFLSILRALRGASWYLLMVREMTSEAAGCKPRPRRIRCCVRAS